MNKLGEFFIPSKDFDKILQTLLKEKVVDKVVSAEIKKDWQTITPKAVDKAGDINDFPLSQFLVFNYDRQDTAANFLRTKLGGARSEKVALVGRPCDQRAIVELAKRLQVKKENLFLILAEDVGTISGKDFGKYAKDSNLDVNAITRAVLTPEKLSLFMKDGSAKDIDLGKDVEIQETCTRCSRKRPLFADIIISTMGIDPKSDQLYIAAGSDRGKQVLEKSGVKLTALTDAQKEAHATEMEKMCDAATEARKKAIAEWKALPAQQKLERLNKCSMCGVCITNCPVCFCKDCNLVKQRKEGTIDNIAYQVTRVTHVGDVCVLCGRCALVCPMNLPLDLYFATMNDFTCEEFGYEPGMEPDKASPRSVQAVRAKAK